MLNNYKDQYSVVFSISTVWLVIAKLLVVGFR